MAKVQALRWNIVCKLYILILIHSFRWPFLKKTIIPVTPSWWKKNAECHVVLCPKLFVFGDTIPFITTKHVEGKKGDLQHGLKNTSSRLTQHVLIRDSVWEHFLQFLVQCMWTWSPTIPPLPTNKKHTYINSYIL